MLHLGSIYFHTVCSCLLVFSWSEQVSAGGFSKGYVVTERFLFPLTSQIGTHYKFSTSILYSREFCEQKAFEPAANTSLIKRLLYYMGTEMQNQAKYLYITFKEYRLAFKYDTNSRNLNLNTQKRKKQTSRNIPISTRHKLNSLCPLREALSTNNFAVRTQGSTLRSHRYLFSKIPLPSGADYFSSGPEVCNHKKQEKPANQQDFSKSYVVQTQVYRQLYSLGLLMYSKDVVKST